MQQIAIKRQELNRLRYTISRTLGPPGHHRRGMILGLLMAAFTAGVMVERWGVKPLASSALSVNRLITLMAPAVAPALAVLYH